MIEFDYTAIMREVNTFSHNFLILKEDLEFSPEVVMVSVLV